MGVASVFTLGVSVKTAKNCDGRLWRVDVASVFTSYLFVCRHARVVTFHCSPVLFCACDLPRAIVSAVLIDLSFDSLVSKTPGKCIW